MRILIGTTNPSKAAYFEALLADAGAAFVMPGAARREGWPLDSLSLNPEGSPSWMYAAGHRSRWKGRIRSG